MTADKNHSMKPVLKCKEETQKRGPHKNMRSLSLNLNHIVKMVAELYSNKMAAKLRNHRLTNEYKQP